MAPIRNSYTTSNHSASNYTQPNSSDSSSVANYSPGNQFKVGVAPPAIGSNTPASTHRKHTGTVPKATAQLLRVEREHDALQEAKSSAVVSSDAGSIAVSDKATKASSKRSGGLSLQQQKQKHVHHQQNIQTSTERRSPFNIPSVAQQTQQQRQQLHHHQQKQQQVNSHQRKNTEIVAPIRRELKDINDYILSAVVTTSNSSSRQLHSSPQQQIQQQAKQHHYSKSQQQEKSQEKGKQQQQQVNENAVITSNTEIDTFCDSQSRYCYPVRPIPRRNLQQYDTVANDFSGTNYFATTATSTTTTITTATTAATSTNLNSLNQTAAIGVVIPTTPGIANVDNNINNSNNESDNVTVNANLNSHYFVDTNEGIAANNLTDTITRVNLPNGNDSNNHNNNYNENNTNNVKINQQNLLLLQQLQQQIEEQSLQLLAVTQQQQQQQQQHQGQQKELEQQQSPLVATQLVDSSAANTARSTAFAGETFGSANSSATIDHNFIQRLQLIQQILALNTTKVNPEVTASNQTPGGINKHRVMVNEVTSPTVTEREVIVNSASLEDVALSEMSDNRAQSVQSLHSAFEETPTPDNCPSYDELQQRLELSNRNILNMQEQQQQLLRLQQQAKLHLSEMEAIRQQGTPLSFGQHNGGDGGGCASSDPPDYQSVQQVHTDMSALVGRMKNLTNFIQHQNELGNLLGDDGPDILAEQEALQRKLESLRVQRDEMRNLVGELQDIHRDAERTAEKRKCESEQREQREQQKPRSQESIAASNNNKNNDNARAASSSSSVERTVPVEYQRIVPTELVAASGITAAQLIDQTDDKVAAEMIRQKVSDIAAMKAQLNRLKTMMETVNLIEEHTARTEPKDIGQNSGAVSGSVDIPVQRVRSPTSFDRDGPTSYDDRERTPTASGAVQPEESNEYISAKVRMLNEVTNDLRAQALSLEAERDRIKALKEEIVRRKAEAAAAAQMGEDALKRHSVTPTPTPHLQRLDSEEQESERELIKAEYQVRKKEFEQLCQRLEQDEGCSTSTPTRPLHQTNDKRDIVSEADDEAEPEEEMLNHSDFAGKAKISSKHYAEPSENASKDAAAKREMRSTSVGTSVNQRSAKRSSEETTAAAAANVAANATSGGAHETTTGSLEAASIKSGSSQSFSMPPPMHSLNGVTNINWLPGPIPPPLPTTWNPHFYYERNSSAQPSATSFTPPHCIGSMHHHHHHQHQATLNSVDCVCSASNSASTLGAGANTAASVSATNVINGGGIAVPLQADPMLLQQFVQTQQMLINSVCQCNQMLWHQQREIDALNNAIHVLQNRLLTLSGPSTADLAFNIRAESVPPPSTLSTGGPVHSNGLYASMENRAQSEQPLGVYLSSHRNNTYANSYHHQQQNLFQQRYHQPRNVVGYNFGVELQQHQHSASNQAASIYTTLNNAVPSVAAAVPQPPPPPSQFNNEAPQSPMTAGGPGPIFMHHHNNTIHQNNANLRTQNHHANNLQPQQQEQQHSNIALNTTSNTLNNQVPPGNRANNYWDNFRSYSRQNLLSTNSNKSNEDQNQQQQQQQHDVPYQPTHLTATGLQQEQQQQQQQPPQQLPAPSQQLYQQGPINQSNTNDCNNLNFDSNNSSSSNHNNIINCNKYFRSLQRNRINQLQQQHMTASSVGNIYPDNVTPSASRELLENLNWPHGSVAASAGDTDSNTIYENYNVAGNGDMAAAATYAASTNANLRNDNNMNMNLNFGSNIQYQRNKVPVKPTCRSTVPLQRVNMQLPASQQQQQQHHYLNAAEAQGYNLLTSSTNPVTAGSAPALSSQAPSALAATPAPAPPLPPPSVAAAALAAPLASRTSERAPDFLLCTVDMASGYNYVPPTSANQDFVAENVAPAANEDDDTTSEEIKRNLLVNALKNDKFTTKFYESIKEDVFRRLESLLLEKETTERQQSSSREYVTQFVNDVGGSVARDPMRKLFLNAQMGNRQQQQQPHSLQSPSLAPSFAPLPQDLKLDLAATTDYDNNITEETESNNADENDLSETSELLGLTEAAANMGASLEDEEPEENENLARAHQRQRRPVPSTAAATTISPAITTTTLNISARRSEACLSHVNRAAISAEQQYPQTLENNANAKKRRNQRQQRTIVTEATTFVDGGAMAMAAEEQKNTTPVVMPVNQSSTSTNNSNSNITKCVDDTANSPDFELINYIITRIYNQTHPNTVINDTLLVEIAKLTATAAQNSNAAKLADAAKHSTTAGDNNFVTVQQHQQLSTVISPKKIYAKMKKLSIPRQRDQFLTWYHGYLETLFFTGSSITGNNNNNSTLHNNNSNNNNSTKYYGSEKKLQQNLSTRNKTLVASLQDCKAKLASSSPGNKSSHGVKLQNGNVLVNPSVTTNSTVAVHNANNIPMNSNAVESLAINDADLAEADQICSANTSSNNSNNNMPDNDDGDDDIPNGDIRRPNVGSNEQIAIRDAKYTPMELKEENNFDELENNENPDEEGATASNIGLLDGKRNNINEEVNVLKKGAKVEKEKDDDEEEEKADGEEHNTSELGLETNTTTLQTTNDFNMNGHQQHVAFSNTSSNSDNSIADISSNNSSVRGAAATATKKDFLKRMKRNSVA